MWLWVGLGIGIYFLSKGDNAEYLLKNGDKQTKQYADSIVSMLNAFKRSGNLNLSRLTFLRNAIVARSKVLAKELTQEEYKALQQWFLTRYGKLDHRISQARQAYNQIQKGRTLKVVDPFKEMQVLQTTTKPIMTTVLFK